MAALTLHEDKYVWHGTFHERDLPKSARFRWDGTQKLWWTDDPRRAAMLSRYATGKAKEVLSKYRTETEAAMTASRATDTDVAIPVPAGRALFGYQKAGVAYAMARPATLIADEMGLGKTCQSLVLVNTDDTIKRILIICPASLKLNWERECKMWLTRKFSIGIAQGDFFPKTDIVICNYDIVERHRANIDAVEWDYLICDEAHYLKSPTARRTAAVLGGTIKAKKGAKK